MHTYLRIVSYGMTGVVAMYLNEQYDDYQLHSLDSKTEQAKN